MNTDFWKPIGVGVLIVTLCCIVNNVLKHFGIVWFDALGAAIGFLTSRIYYYKQIIKLGERV